MPNIDPKIRFWISFIVTVTIGISSGTVVLTNVIPADFIPYAVGWCGFISFIGSTLLMILNGGAMTISSRVASAASVIGMNKMEVSPEVAAQITPATRQDAQITVTK